MDVYAPIDLSRLVRPKRSRLWIWLPFSLVLIGLMLNGLSHHSYFSKKDLDAQFIVTDANTGNPLEEAKIFIHSTSSGFCEECGDNNFILTTRADGKIAFRCRRCDCRETKSYLQDKFEMWPPMWVVSAHAPGYRDFESTYLC